MNFLGRLLRYDHSPSKCFEAAGRRTVAHIQRKYGTDPDRIDVDIACHCPSKTAPAETCPLDGEPLVYAIKSARPLYVHADLTWHTDLSEKISAKAWEAGDVRPQG